jgi:tRNA pseudouridine38-40 synthase
MPRYRLTIEYDGTNFVGWQTQASGTSVQGAIEDAIARINGGPSTVVGAGRTDAGVHALGQIAHVDLTREWDTFELRNAINGNIRPHAVSILEAGIVPNDFHARFSAVRRRYLYRILTRRAPPAIERNRVWHVPQDLDAEAMHEAAQTILGNHDFTTFRSGSCQAQSPVKTLDRLDVMRFGETIEIRAEARSFLHKQVRSMVGSLKLVGSGKWRVSDMADALRAKDRGRCGPVAPPCGLYLVTVDY